jgi:ABC-type multidrug transport system ATPase subunit
MITALEARAVSKSFGSVQALDRVSLAARAGEVTGLIGPNGSGKTTLLECLAGLLSIDDGAVRSSPHFYLPDAIGPWEDESVGWVLDFFRRYHGVTKERADELSGALSLTAFLSRRIGEISKGQRKRALLALGLLVPRPVLLLDEPLDGLDLRQARDVTGMLRKEAEKGRTLLIAVHQLSDAARLCDRFVLLQAGRVVAAGTLDELRELAGLGSAAPPEPPTVPSARLPGAILEDVFLALT